MKERKLFMKGRKFQIAVSVDYNIESERNSLKVIRARRFIEINYPSLLSFSCVEGEYNPIKNHYFYFAKNFIDFEGIEEKLVNEGFAKKVYVESLEDF